VLKEDGKSSIIALEGKMKMKKSVGTRKGKCIDIYTVIFFFINEPQGWYKLYFVLIVFLLLI
jgi:hypothetical protein